jgi:sortase A
MMNRTERRMILRPLILIAALTLVLAGCGGAVTPPAPPAPTIQAAPTVAEAVSVAADATAPAATSTPVVEPTVPPTAVAPAQVEPVAPETAAPASEAAAAATATTAPTSDPALAGEMPVAAQAGPPVRLVFPALGLDAPVVPMGWAVVETASGPVSQWQIPENEAGHHINSVSLGEPGNLVISGHNNIYGRVFESISRAWKDDARVRVDSFTDQSDVLNGQQLELYDAGGERFDYRVEEFYRLRDTGVSQQQRVKNASLIQPTQDDRVTLVTCWPPWNNTHRLVIIARPVSQP